MLPWMLDRKLSGDLRRDNEKVEFRFNYTNPTPRGIGWRWTEKKQRGQKIKSTCWKSI